MTGRDLVTALKQNSLKDEVMESPALGTWFPTSRDHFQGLRKFPLAESAGCLRRVHTPGWRVPEGRGGQQQCLLQPVTVLVPERRQRPRHCAEHLSRPSSWVTGPGCTLPASRRGTGPPRPSTQST